MVSGSSIRGVCRGGASRYSLTPTTAQAGALAAVLLAAFTALVLVGGRAKGIAAAVSTVGFPAMALVYVPLAALAAKRARGRLRVAWLIMTAGWASMALGDLLWVYYKNVHGRVPFPSWVDVAMLSYAPLIAVGLLVLPGGGSWRDRGRMVLDGLLVTCSFFLISWVAVMRTAWHTGADSTLQFVISVAYPAGDLLLVTLGFFVLMKAPSALRPTLTVLVVGLACSAVGNGVWAYLGDPEAYKVGGVPDIFYAANYLLISVALVSAQHVQPGTDSTTAEPGRLSLWLPLVPVALAAAFLALTNPGAVTEAPVMVAGAVLVVVTLLRQFTQSAELVQHEQEIRDLADHLADELDSASRYVDSILPLDVVEPIAVCSRYLPSRSVGGDCFGYQWIDDDHLIVYLVDVSGHGVQSALLSVSVHNLLRSGGLARETLLAPDRVLTVLNRRFNMESHDSHYFTMWYGVYQLSTGELRYVNAGHPPPLVLTGEAGAVDCRALNGSAVPVGMFPESDFTTESFSVPAGSQILLYSDGVLGTPPQFARLVAMCTELRSEESCWLDRLATRLPATDDDRSLVLLIFPDGERASSRTETIAAQELATTTASR